MASNYLKSKKAFTLIEVMVAVMIISVVIIALLEMYANNTHIFKSLKKQTSVNQYASFFISNENYGFKKDELYIYNMLNNFDFKTDLRQDLKQMKAKIIYQKIDVIKYDSVDSNNLEQDSSIAFEIGKTVLKLDKESVAFIRFKIQ